MITHHSSFSSYACDVNQYKNKIIWWAEQFSVFCFLDSNSHMNGRTKYDFLCGVDVLEWIQLDEDYQGNQEFLFGIIPYTSNTSKVGNFFRPRYIIYAKNGRLYFNRNYPEMMALMDQINSFASIIETDEKINSSFMPLTSSEQYHENIESIQNKIRQGDYYEINYCIGLEANEVTISPISSFIKINRNAAAPMSALYKNEASYVLSFSPERFIKKKSNRITSQPIKGTIRRDRLNLNHDLELKNKLANSQKERAENMMIADLTRHDLTHYAIPGSIHVEELCQVYSYHAVHHMISTISAELKNSHDGLRALFKAFPPASMTGAPKKIVMCEIDQIETFQRNYYSGALGYIDPEGDYDFSVVIRTLFYNQKSKKINIYVGSAITLLSDAKSEYEECLLKAEGIIQYLKR